MYPNEHQPQAFDGIIRKRHFLPTEAADPEECQPGAAGAEGRLMEKNAHTGGGVKTWHGQIPDGIFWVPGSSHVWSKSYFHLKNSGWSSWHISQSWQTLFMHRAFRTGDEWWLCYKSGLSVPESVWRSIDWYLPSDYVRCLLVSTWTAILAMRNDNCLLTCLSPLLEWDRLLGRLCFGEERFIWCLLTVRLSWVLYDII